MVKPKKLMTWSKIPINPFHYIESLMTVCAYDINKFSNPELEPLKVLSSSGIRATKFLSVYNFPAQ